MADVKFIIRTADQTRKAEVEMDRSSMGSDIVQAAVDGILPRGLGVSRLMVMPPNWADQRSIIGIAPRH